MATFGAGQPWLGAAALVDRLFTAGRPAVEQVEDFSTRQTWEISVRGVEMGGEPADAAVVVVRDISRVISLEESLRHSETMAAMGSLLASVAHEVRNPLFAISSILDAWAVRGPEANVPAYQAVLRKEVDRLRDLMEELLGRAPARATCVRERLPTSSARPRRRATLADQRRSRCARQSDRCCR